jgi:hypothetical protein
LAAGVKDCLVRLRHSHIGQDNGQFIKVLETRREASNCSLQPFILANEGRDFLRAELGCLVFFDCFGRSSYLLIGVFSIAACCGLGMSHV